ncbi:DUF2164 domain-containing protein [Magnetococcus sp. PR-3]|uniref:DUF2164 domain-containing protein n=1 Tax=Magnetococcus sp. PR-3 TaxID=3120355 RepID=UPI002FCE08FE
MDPQPSLTPQQRDHLVNKLKAYLLDEMELDAGRFETEFLLDFITKEMGGYFYNHGLKDARAILEAKLVQIDDEIYEKEMPTDHV